MAIQSEQIAHAELVGGGETALHSHAGGGGAAFPVGAVFLAVVNTNPNTLLGYGTWTQIAQGQFLVGQDSTDADFDTAEETGGAKTVDIQHSHSLSAHTHTINHEHAITATNLRTGGAELEVDPVHAGSSGAPSTDTTNAQLSTTQSILPPYFVVYVWKRTA
jgi:hypothetical protein